MKNIGKKDVLVINHKNDSGNVKRAGQPKALFTFAIGGNIVSRGLTFEKSPNLLLFSECQKQNYNKIHTFKEPECLAGDPIQNISNYVFQKLCLKNWAECFHDHEVSLRLAKAGEYLHVYGSKTQVVDAGAIDKLNVSHQNSERNVGEIFPLTKELESALINFDLNDPMLYIEKLIDAGVMPESAIAPALRMYLHEITSEEQKQFFLVLKTDEEGKKVQSIEKL